MYRHIEWCHKAVKLDQVAKHVLITLCIHAGEKTDQCWQSLSTLVSETGMARGTLAKKLNQLEKLGYINRKRQQPKKGKNMTTIYTINVKFPYDSTKNYEDFKAGKISIKPLPEGQDLVSVGDYPSLRGRLGVVSVGDPKVIIESNIKNKDQPSTLSLKNKERVDGGQKPRKKIGYPPCPHDEIIALYHELLPQAQKVRVWSKSRQVALRARWESQINGKPCHVIEFWRWYFGHVAESSWLTGKIKGRDGRYFNLTLPWLIKLENFIKVLEDHYRDR